MTTKAKSVGAYITAAPKDRRAALTRLRKTIKAAAPKATEAISYGMGSRVLDEFSALLKPYIQSKGTIQLPADKPFPYGLVTKMVKAGIAEIKDAS